MPGDCEAGIVAAGLALDPKAAITGGKAVQVDERGKAFVRAVEDIGGTGVGVPGVVRARGDDQVVDAVIVQIARGGDRVAGMVPRALALDLEAAEFGRRRLREIRWREKTSIASWPFPSGTCPRGVAGTRRL